MFRLVHEPARRLGMRIIAPERPGFGLSTFQHNRTLADWASDMMEFANHLGLKHFGVAGISGGGPYAAACAALLPSRVTAAALINPVGPLCAPEGPEKIGDDEVCDLPGIAARNPRHEGVFRALAAHVPECAGFHVRLPQETGLREDKRILHQPEIRRNFVDGVSEGLRPGIRGIDAGDADFLPALEFALRRGEGARSAMARHP